MGYIFSGLGAGVVGLVLTAKFNLEREAGAALTCGIYLIAACIVAMVR